jgi:hypothetical protein
MNGNITMMMEHAHDFREQVFDPTRSLTRASSRRSGNAHRPRSNHDQPSELGAFDTQQATGKLSYLDTPFL